MVNGIATVTEEANAATTPDSSRIWHQYLGYIAMTTLQQMAKNNSIKGLPIATTTPDNNDFCEDYMMNKATRKPFHEQTEHTSSPLELIYMDIFGLARTITNREN